MPRFTHEQIKQARELIAEQLTHNPRDQPWTGEAFATLLWGRLPWVKTMAQATALLKAALRFEAN